MIIKATVFFRFISFRECDLTFSLFLHVNKQKMILHAKSFSNVINDIKLIYLKRSDIVKEFQPIS